MGLWRGHLAGSMGQTLCNPFATLKARGRRSPSPVGSGKAVDCPGPAGPGDGSADRPGAAVEVDLWYAWSVTVLARVTPGGQGGGICGRCGVVGDQPHAG